MQWLQALAGFLFRLFRPFRQNFLVFPYRFLFKRRLITSRIDGAMAGRVQTGLAVVPQCAARLLLLLQAAFWGASSLAIPFLRLLSGSRLRTMAGNRWPWNGFARLSRTVRARHRAAWPTPFRSKADRVTELSPLPHLSAVGHFVGSRQGVCRSYVGGS